MYMQLSDELFLDIDGVALASVVASLALAKIFVTVFKYYIKKGK